jgi:hypothetical protein
MSIPILQNRRKWDQRLNRKAKNTRIPAPIVIRIAIDAKHPIKDIPSPSMLWKEVIFPQCGQTLDEGLITAPHWRHFFIAILVHRGYDVFCFASTFSIGAKNAIRDETRSGNGDGVERHSGTTNFVGGASSTDPRNKAGHAGAYNRVEADVRLYLANLLQGVWGQG